jgi:hypothetical protein
MEKPIEKLEKLRQYSKEIAVVLSELPPKPREAMSDE